jgi:outer membrane protein W
LELNTSPDYLYWTEFPSSKKGWSYTLTNYYTIESRVMNGTARPFFEIGVHHGYFIAQQYKAKNAINVYNWGIIAGIGMYLHLKKCELPIRIRYCYGNKVDMATLTIGYTFKLK